jgi:glycosyltransferase involved in cell wall biosynthesis
MKIIGILPARNEDWILGFSVRSALMWMDELIVMNHASTDHTVEILRKIQTEVGHSLTVIDQPNPAWMQYEYRQELLGYAREHDASHVAFLDADEALTANLLPEIRMFVGNLQPGECLSLPVPCMWRSPLKYRTGDFRYAGSQLTIAFADAPAIRWTAVDGYQHDHRQPLGIDKYVHVPVESGGVMHFEWADWRRITAKHAWYKMENVVRWPGRKTIEEIDALYSQALEEEGLELKTAPAAWFAGYEHLLPQIKRNVVPWHEAECKRLWEEYGPETFEGLNLWGVAP